MAKYDYVIDYACPRVHFPTHQSGLLPFQQEGNIIVHKSLILWETLLLHSASPMSHRPWKYPVLPYATFSWLQPVMKRHCKWRHARSLYPRMPGNRHLCNYYAALSNRQRNAARWNPCSTVVEWFPYSSAFVSYSDRSRKELETKSVKWLRRFPSDVAYSCWRTVSTVWCTLRTFSLPALFFHCITVYKQPPPSLPKQHYHAVW